MLPRVLFSITLQSGTRLLNHEILLLLQSVSLFLSLRYGRHGGMCVNRSKIQSQERNTTYKVISLTPKLMLYSVSHFILCAYSRSCEFHNYNHHIPSQSWVHLVAGFGTTVHVRQ
jgi:hypothetical protein